MTDPHIPIGPREQAPATPSTPARPGPPGAAARRTLTAGAWLLGAWEDTNDDH
jgi:hypothetical protein